MRQFFRVAAISPLVPIIIGLLTVGPDPADATLIVNYAGSTTVGMNTTYNYTANLSAGDVLVNPGNSFTIFDFYGFNGMFSMPAGWTFSSPPDISNPTVPDAVFTYSGIGTFGPQVFSGFQVGSTIAATTAHNYTAITGTGSNSGTVTGPAPPPVPGPEPGTVGMLVSGLVVMWGLYRRQGSLRLIS